MTKRYIRVRVCNAAGSPVRDARVSVQIHQFMAGGFSPDQRTDADGAATFELEMDTGADVTLYVNGQPKSDRGAPKGEYLFYI